MLSKRLTYITVIFSFILYLGISSVSFAEDQMVDIGLFYGSNSQYPAGISSDSGFVYRLEKVGSEAIEIDLSNYNALKVYKAGFYQNSSLVTGSQTYYESGNVKGAFTVLVGLKSSDFQIVFDRFLQYKAMDPEISLFFDGEWGIVYGNYLNLDNATSAIKSVAAIFPNDVGQAIQLPRGQMIAYGDGHPLISFDTSIGDSIFAADLIDFNDGVYREGLMFKRIEGSDYSVINHLKIDAYLYGVLPKEMSTSWPLEALKAQAVAARNYTLINLNKHQAMGFDLCNTTDCQVYGGYLVEGAVSNAAVDSTGGLVLTYQGEIASCYYHSNSGGETEDISNIWTGDLPYIKGISDSFSIGQPNDSWTLSLSANDIQTALSSYGKGIGTYQSVEVNSVSDHGRVTKITFKGTSGSATLLKEEMRKVFGYTTLKSMYFTLEPPVETFIYMTTSSGVAAVSPATLSVMTSSGIASVTTDAYVMQASQMGLLRDSIVGSTTMTQDNTSGLTIYGKGYGHGLGMSQWGAKAMADLGYTFEEILLHYYSDTKVSALN